jgi:hypothetical protein
MYIKRTAYLQYVVFMHTRVGLFYPTRNARRVIPDALWASPDVVIKHKSRVTGDLVHKKTENVFMGDQRTCSRVTGELVHE